MSAKRSASKRIPRAKRATTVAPQTMGQIQSMREQQIGFLGRLDVDTMATMASYLLMSDRRTIVGDIRALASILACVPSSVCSSNVLWAAFNTAEFFRMPLSCSIWWVYTITSVADKPLRKAIWNAIDSQTVDHADLHKHNLIRLDIARTIMKILLMDEKPDRAVHGIMDTDYDCIIWALKTLRGHRLCKMPDHAFDLCADLVIRGGDVSRLRSLPPADDDNVCVSRYMYRIAIDTSEEMVVAVIDYFMKMESCVITYTLLQEACDLDRGINRDDDVIRMFTQHQTPLGVCHIIGHFLVKLTDPRRFAKIFAHIIIPLKYKLTIADKHIEAGTTDDEIFRLVDEKIGDINEEHLANFEWAAQIRLAARYGTRGCVIEMWNRCVEQLTPELYKTLVAIPVFQKTRPLEMILTNCANSAIYPLLIRDGLVVDTALIEKVLEKSICEGTDTVHHIKFLLEHLKITQRVAIQLLVVLMRLFKSHPKECECVRSGIADIMKQLKACNFASGEFRDFCRAAVRNASDPYDFICSLIATSPESG
jgi:hypothetical protein